MQRGRRDLGGIELLREVEREHDLRELGLRVGARAVVAALEHHVAEVERRLPGRRDLHDPRRR